MAKTDEWWKCLKALLAALPGSPGAVLALAARADEGDANALLIPHGLAIWDMPGDEGPDADTDGPLLRRVLVVPAQSDALDRLLAGSGWEDGRHWQALRAAPGSIVLRERGGTRHLIGGINMMVVYVDLAAWDTWCAAHVPDTRPDVAGRQLRAFIERIERLEEERADLAADVKDVFSEAKGSGFDVKAMRRVIALRKLDPDEREGQAALVEMYWDAVAADVGEIGTDVLRP